MSTACAFQTKRAHVFSIQHCVVSIADCSCENRSLRSNKPHARVRKRLNMEPVHKESDSLNKEKGSQPSTSENTPDKSVSAEMEGVKVEQDHSNDESLELRVDDGTMIEVTRLRTGSEYMEESEELHTTDPNDSIGEISEDVFGESEIIETEKKVMSGESQSFAEESDISKVEIPSHENLYSLKPGEDSLTIAKGKKQHSEEELFPNAGRKREDPGDLTEKKLQKDQCCQADRGNARSDEVQILKEKLAMSKEDTKTLQKLLEDVRKDYEQLQKNFEKRESETKSAAFVEEIAKGKDETKKEKAELKRKTSKKDVKGPSASNESRSLEKRKNDKEDKGIGGGGSSDMTSGCPCFAPSIRKIITDATEDFKETISVIKQSSLEEREGIARDLAQLKDEYKCALEKKDTEVRAFEEIIKGLQSRIRESEREVVGLRDSVSSAYEEKLKLYDDIRALKDELEEVQRDSKTSRSDLKKIKLGLKKFCTAEEYEELEHKNFKFSDSEEVEGTPRQPSERDDDETQLRNKEAKFSPVLKKAKKEILKLKEEKQDAENRLLEKVSKAMEKEKHLYKKLNKALSEIKQSESETTELTKQLEALKLENSKLNADADEQEEQLEDMRRERAQQLKTMNEKLKISNDRLRLTQEKYSELQVEYKILRDGYNDLKKFVDNMNAKKIKVILNDSSDDYSSEQLIKDDPSLKKQLKIEKDRNEKFQNEIQLLKKDVDLWKEIAGDERYAGGVGYLKIENEDLKQEIQDHQDVIRQLISKKKDHVRIIKKLRKENSSLKGSCNASVGKHVDFLLESEDELESEVSDTTSTQEHRVRFDRRGNMDNEKQSELFDEEDDSLSVHFVDDDDSLGKSFSLTEILEYDVHKRG